MSSFYNIKSTPGVGKFIVTKFDDDLNVESSYEFHNTIDGMICHCPAGQRPSCRHRQMFPLLQTRVDSAWMLDFDTRQWVDPTGEASLTKEDIQQAIDMAEIVLDEGPQGSLGSSPSTKPHSTMVSAEDFESSDEGSSPSVAAKVEDTHPFRRRM